MARGGAPSTTSVAVIGAGPCGLAAAIALKQAGARPSSTTGRASSSSVASYPTYMTFFSTAEKISIGGLPFVTAGEKPTRREALAYYRMVVQHFGVLLRLYEPVLEIVRAGEHFVVRSETARGAVEAPYDAVVIATGYFGNPEPAAHSRRVAAARHAPILTRGTRRFAAMWSSLAAATRRSMRRSTCGGAARR